jgi:hypothetical protein
MVTSIGHLFRKSNGTLEKVMGRHPSEERSRPSRRDSIGVRRRLTEGASKLPLTFNRYKVMLVGSVPVQTVSEVSKLPFRIKGEINIAAIRSNSALTAAKEAMRSFALRPLRLLLRAEVFDAGLDRFAMSLSHS